MSKFDISNYVAAVTKGCSEADSVVTIVGNALISGGMDSEPVAFIKEKLTQVLSQLRVTLPLTLPGDVGPVCKPYLDEVSKFHQDNQLVLIDELIRLYQIEWLSIQGDA